MHERLKCSDRFPFPRGGLVIAIRFSDFSQILTQWEMGRILRHRQLGQRLRFDSHFMFIGNVGRASPEMVSQGGSEQVI